MKRVERSSILDICIKDNWYKAQVSLGDMCLTVSLIDNYLDSVLNENSGGKENNMPIFISKIFKDTPADLIGQLNIGDSILSVNGESLVEATHEDAVKCLKRAGNKADLEVKYLREVMLQYKKASLLPDIGWNFNLSPNKSNLLNQHIYNHQNNHRSDDKISQKSSNDSFFISKSASEIGSNLTKLKIDTRLVPLLLCYVYQNTQTISNSRQQMQDEFNDPCIITIFSLDLTRKFILRCPDELSAYTWSSAICNEIHEATLQCLAEANMNLSSILNQSTIKYMGWLNEKVDQTDNSAYRPKFLVLTNKELLFFDKMPYTIENWMYPSSRYPLEQCRLVKTPIDTASSNNVNKLNQTNGSNGYQNLKNSNKSNSFALRIGTLQGLITVQLSSDSYQLLLIWAKKIIESSCNRCIALQEASFNCIFEGKKCDLTINIDHGFTVTNSENGEILLKKDFSELVNSSDDRARFVTLQFKDEKVSRDFDLLQHPKPFIFTLHTFLFVKMTKLGFV